MVSSCCRDSLFSVQFGGDLEGVMYPPLFGFFNALIPGVQHIVKKTPDRFGHIHFISREKAARFFYSTNKPSCFGNIILEYNPGLDAFGNPLTYDRPPINENVSLPTNSVPNMSDGPIINFPSSSEPIPTPISNCATQLNVSINQSTAIKHLTADNSSDKTVLEESEKSGSFDEFYLGIGNKKYRFNFDKLVVESLTLETPPGDTYLIEKFVVNRIKKART